MKCRYLDEVTGGRGVIFATGTPVSDSMVELCPCAGHLQFEHPPKEPLAARRLTRGPVTLVKPRPPSELAPEGYRIPLENQICEIL